MCDNDLNKELATNLDNKFSGQKPSIIIEWFTKHYKKEEIVFTTSFGAEDQVLTDIIVSIDSKIIFLTIDTGRLFQETYNTMERTVERYGIKIKTIFPDYKMLEKMVDDKGINLFYYSVENRKLCCNIRKKEPLNRTLKNFKIWITGLRRAQSITRNNMRTVEWDEEHKMIKVNPLIDWSENDVWDYIKQNNIPYNSLHNKGFRSIGCLPCTRATGTENDIRAGRWWWENPENKECGLHTDK